MENYGKKGVNRGIIERIKEIYEETENFVRIEGTLTKSFWTAERVRQGCASSPTLFKIYTLKMEGTFRKEQERNRQKYISWCLNLERCTPGYMILVETKRNKIRAGQRAMQYEERLRNAMGINILKECLKEERETTKIRNTQERREYLMKNGYNQAGIDQLRERNVNVVKTLKERDKELQKQTQYNKIREGSQRLIARARCWNLEEGN